MKGKGATIAEEEEFTIKGRKGGGG